MAQSGYWYGHEENEEKVDTTAIDYTSFLPPSLLSEIDHKKWVKQPPWVWMGSREDDQWVYEQVKVKAIEEARAFTWLEGMMLSKIDQDRIKKANQKTVHKALEPQQVKCSEKVKEYLNNIEGILNKMMLFDMNDPIGHVVFSKEAWKVGEAFGLYLGEYYEKSSVPRYVEYTYVFESKIENFSKQFLIDSTKVGNISRFLPHLITDEVLKAAELPDTIDRTKIATENVYPYGAQLDGKEVPVFVVTKPIGKNELCGFSYGPQYWAGQEFWLFYKEGAKAAKVKYNAKGNIVFVAYPTKADEMISRKRKSPYVSGGGTVFSASSMPAVNKSETESTLDWRVGCC